MSAESKRVFSGLALARRRPRRFRFALLALWSCSAVACSRCASEAEGVSGRDAPSVTASAGAALQPSAGSEQPSEAPKPQSPLATPSTPPQLVACGPRGFHRITRSSLQAFELGEQVPPPHIRGGSVARQTVKFDVSDPLNLLSLEKGRVLVIARNSVLSHELGETQSRRYAPIAEPEPLLAWSDPTSPDSFWVRAVGSESLNRYSLSALAPSAKASSSSPARPGRVQPLPGFDARLFTPLADGSFIYSTKTGLRRLSSAAGPAPLPELAATPALLFADSSPTRYWAADASGNLVLSELERGESAVVTTRVPGVVIDVAREGERMAVLSLELQGQSYRPSVTIFERGERRGQLSVGPSIATGVQPQLDLCLVAGRPWVVVGNRHWLQLLDWTAPRLLAEW